jgi:hypothetical protein
MVIKIIVVVVVKVTELRKHMMVGGHPEPMERTFTVASLTHNNLNDGMSTLHSHHHRELQEYRNKLEEVGN